MNIGRIARVSRVDLHLSRVYLDFPGGLSGHFDITTDDNWEVGDVLFCEDGKLPEKVDAALWPAPNDVGTVRMATTTQAVVETNGRLQAYSQRNDPPLIEGQSLEVEPTGQLGAVLSDKPIDRLGMRDHEDFTVESLIVQPDRNPARLGDFGGSPGLVKRARDLVTAALDPDNRMSKIGANPVKGILFAGPSGTGKTFLAKALAGERYAKFYNIAGPTIVDQFVGQSEKRLRSIFEHAEQNRPAILFFDEIDSLYTQRGSANHEATNRLVGQFLSLLDGFTSFDQVIVIATTNLPGSLDNALLRPGRLGHKLFFSLPDASNRLSILEASAKNISFSETPDLEKIADMTSGWSAADLVAIWTEAAVLAILDGREALCREDVNEALPRVQRMPTPREESSSSAQIQ